jgi:hypothetical protein
MLFPCNALASGPQAWLGAEKGLFKVKVGKKKPSRKGGNKPPSKKKRR